jgi:hypothetical protein
LITLARWKIPTLDRSRAARVTARSSTSNSARSAKPSPPAASDLLLPVHLRLGEVEMRVFSTIRALGTPQDVTLQELRIETFFPADDESEEAWRSMGGTSD